MTWLLDSNVCIQILNGSNSMVLKRASRIRKSDLLLCSVVKSELFFGAYKSRHKSRNLATLIEFFDSFQSFDFDDSAAEVAGEIRSDLAKRGTPIGPNDLLIAAIAIANDATLVTHNTAEFSRISGLKLEDWEA